MSENYYFGYDAPPEDMFISKEEVNYIELGSLIDFLTEDKVLSLAVDDSFYFSFATFLTNITNITNITNVYISFIGNIGSKLNCKQKEKTLEFINLIPEHVNIDIIESIDHVELLGNNFLPTKINNVMRVNTSLNSVTKILASNSLELQIDTTILGSCDSRDILRVYKDTYKKNTFKINSYISNNSIASLLAQKIDYNEKKINIKSEFLTQCVKHDLDKTTLEQTIKSLQKESLFIIDLMDERFDLLIYNDSVITNSWSFRSTEAKNELKAETTLNFNSKEKLEISINAISNLISLASEIIPSKNIIINKVFMCSHYFDGEKFIKFDKVKYTIDEYNSFVEYIYDHIKINHSGVTQLDSPYYISFCDSNHLWGAHPYHYNNTFYLSRAKQLKLLAMRE